MRLVTTLVTVVVLSSLTGCAAQTAVTRGEDTAVRAEARRISNTGPLAERGVPVSAPAHARGVASF